jgi:hypothetical protein
LRREDYTRAQGKRWAKWVEGQAGAWGAVFVYFKHEDTAVGTKFARWMVEALKL